MNSTELAVRQSVQTGLAGRETSKYGDVLISGNNAIVQLGDRYGSNKDLFEAGSDAERRTTLLNLLYYEGLDLKREQLALTDIGPKSFAWIEATSFPDWLQSDNDLFWINGKPGSGKSTLMKFLADSRSTLERLSKNGQQWAVVHFFFDYRAADSTANCVLGMLKLFLRQLSITAPAIREQLLDELVQKTLRNDRVDTYIDVISQVITTTGISVCAFVDGLDEYDGDIWNLCSSLELLQSRTGIKLCLASRPEKAFEISFMHCSTITMQEHNQVSIRLYAQRKVTKFLSIHPFREDLFTAELLEAVTEKAQGVILWARLVVDEMIKSCDDTTITTDLFELLETLPEELEPLYERILGKTNQNYQKEVAEVLHILVENDATMKAATLFQTWDFIDTVITCTRKSTLATTSTLGATSTIDFPVYEARVKALLGNLIDLVRPSKKPVSIRLLHRSLSTYLARTSWMASRLPETLVQAFPDAFTKRIAISCIEKAGRDAAFNAEELELNLAKLIQNAEKRKLEFEPKPRQRIFKQHWISSRDWVKWADLLLYCVDIFFSTETRGSYDQILQLPEMAWPGGASGLALLHFMRCNRCMAWVADWQCWNPVLRLHQAGVLDIMLLLMHDCDQLTEYELTKRSSTMSRDVVADLFDAFLLQEERRRTRGQSNMKLLNWFAGHECFVGAHHLCLYYSRTAFRPRIGILNVLKDATCLKPAQRRSISHHRDCKGLQGGVMFHWVYSHDTGIGDSASYEQLLDLALALGVDVSAHVQREGQSLYHEILQHATLLGGIYLQDARKKFTALAKVGMRPLFKRGHKDLLAFTKALQVQVRNKLPDVAYSKVFPSVPGYDGILNRRQQQQLGAFFAQVVEAIKYYQSHDKQWPDLEKILTPR